MKHSSICLLFALAALHTGVISTPAPQFIGIGIGEQIPPMPSPTFSSTHAPSSTSSTLTGAPVPTSISIANTQNNPASSSLQKSLNISLNHQGTKLTVQVTSSSSGSSFRGDFNLQTEGTPHAGASFYGRQNDTESFFRFRVGLLKLVELNTAANWNLTSSGNVINFANLSSNYWSPITIADVPNDKNVAIKSISTTFSMRDPNWSPPSVMEKAVMFALIDGSFAATNITVKFEAYMVNDTVTLDNVTHTPKSLKYSLRISNFPYRRDDSQLAIVKGVYFKKGEETNYSAAASSLAIAGGKGHFNWTNAITVDSVASTLSTDSSISVEDVPDSNPPESVAHVVFKTSARFSNLVWDPEVILEEQKLTESYYQERKSGVENLLSTGSSFTVFTVVSIVMILLNGF